MLKWWNNVVNFGTLIGYYPKASKSWLVVKQQQFETAKHVFKDTNINITIEGRKYLGGFVGTENAHVIHIKEKINVWKTQLETLTEIAKIEPQAAYTAFVTGYKHKLTYYMRSITNLSEYLKPLDDFIDTKFIPAITEGHICSPTERSLIALPTKLGGLGIPILAELASQEYCNSKELCAPLSEQIIQQKHEYVLVNNESSTELRKNIKKRRTKYQQDQLKKIQTHMTTVEKRANEIAQLKGSSSWLTSLPLAEEKFVLNKREFYDALYIRYRWNLKRLPINCSFGKKFTLDHAVSCLKGGFIHQRHDEIRNLIAKTLDDVYKEVAIEPPLAPLTGKVLGKSELNVSDEARLDIAARGFWQKYEMAFFDVRVFNPFAKS